MQDELLRSFEEEQLSMHTPTPVWKMRDKPPEEWGIPDAGGLSDPNNTPHNCEHDRL